MTALEDVYTQVPTIRKRMSLMRFGIVNRLAYHRQAGITRYTRSLMFALQALNPDPRYRFTVFRHRKHAAAALPPGNWDHRILLSPAHHAWEQRMLAWELRRLRLDGAHFPDFIGPYRSPLKTVITVHDLAFLRWPEHLTPEAQAYYGQLPAAIDHARAVITPSRRTRDDLVAYLPQAAEKVRVIHSGVNPVFQAPSGHAQPADDGLPAHFLLHVGTLEPRKNIPALLDAFSLLRRAQVAPDLHLVLAGAAGWGQDNHAARVQALGLESVCLFRHRLSDAGLVRAYQRARCLMHPAFYEGFGFTLLEAMACGTPVVASRASCLPEIAGEAALFAEPHDAEGLAAQARRLLEDRELAQAQIARGFKRAAQFTWASAAARTLEVYETVCQA